MKTKTMKKILAASVAAFMMCAAIPMNAGPKVSAANSYDVTISNGSDGVSRTYTAYQIFKGDASNGTLSNITWNESVINSSAFLTALNGLDSSKFSAGMTAVQVAEKLAEYNETNDLDKLVQFAALAKANLQSSAPGTDISGGSASLEEGYYLFIDKTTSQVAAFSRGILAVVGPTTIAPKYDYPTVDKKIGTDFDDGVTANTASVGDDVNYIIQSTVPDMTGYDQYFYVIKDTMTAGLTYKADSVKVAFDTNSDGHIDENDTVLTKDSEYYLSVSSDNKTIEIAFVNFIQYKGKTEKILVSYNAELGSDNLSLDTNGSNANKNTVTLEYSNNPNVTNSGDSSKPGYPDSNTPTGTTPPKTVVTYTASIKITKTKSDGITALQGAGFTLYNSSGNPIGTEQISGSDGTLSFTGLGIGNYTIKETTVPAGYNKAPDYTLVIGTDSIDTSSCSWKIDSGSDTIFSITSASSEYTATIVNLAGATLPGTGGIGTTIFYVSGGALVVGAAVVLITRKRMSLKEDKK